MKTHKVFFLIAGILSSVLINTNAKHKPSLKTKRLLNETTNKIKRDINKRSRNFLIAKDLFVEINTCHNAGCDNLAVQISGLKESKKKLALKVDGSVTNSQIADLNYNGFPEILIYTKSAAAEGYGNIICFSVNTDKNITPIALPDIYRNAAACKGYMGHDKFTVEKNTLVRKFPVYNLNDAESKPTGGTRAIKYALIGSGEALRFVISEISK